MKLWHLKPRDDIEGKANPWKPWFDKAFGFVVRAETEQDARRIANENGGDEAGPIEHIVYRTGGNPWLDPAYSNCSELIADGEPGCIIRDFASA